MIRKYLFLSVLLLTPLFSMAQASGGQVKRPVKKTTTKTTKRAEKQTQKKQHNKTSGHVKDLEEREINNLSQVIPNLMNNMVHVEGGTFTMGATPEQGNDATDRAKPAHQVTLSSFYIGKYEVTQEEWQAVMGSNPSEYKGAKLPVENVSWADCQVFIRKLNALTGKQFRLPTEEEWEYAARGGNLSTGYKYSGSDSLDTVAWYAGNMYDVNRGYFPHEVGQKKANELGIYDMSGSVSEWCYTPKGTYINSTGTKFPGRVIRGGCWLNREYECRLSWTCDYPPSHKAKCIGLRLTL